MNELATFTSLIDAAAECERMVDALRTPLRLPGEHARVVALLPPQRWRQGGALRCVLLDHGTKRLMCCVTVAIVR